VVKSEKLLWYIKNTFGGIKTAQWRFATSPIRPIDVIYAVITGTPPFFCFHPIKGPITYSREALATQQA